MAVEMTLEKGFPSLLADARGASRSGQDSYVRLTGAGLLVALIAAVGGATNVDLSIGGREFDAGGAVAGVAFLVGIGVTIFFLVTRPERTWYEGRAAAESIKTLCWQYSVGGGIFGLSNGQGATQLLLLRLREVVEAMKTTELRAVVSGSQVTEQMTLLRDQPLSVRRATYLHERLDGQIQWYSDRAISNRARVKRWFAAAISFQLAGALLGMIKAFGIAEVDLLGVAAAIAAGISAWVQTKDHQNLSESYALAAREIALVRTMGDRQVDEDELAWSRFVDDAEQAISREHTSWLARRRA
ncbi:DUF4231 domain-containing protein [Micromonospora sp. CPCC 205539]|uniref:DUF4231 domain-containing protein n=1 Tax=Micromonospora sp. CPCC 205539 TaxID=3122408 RepID=UPI002FF428B2